MNSVSLIQGKMTQWWGQWPQRTMLSHPVWAMLSSHLRLDDTSLRSRLILAMLGFACLYIIVVLRMLDVALLHQHGDYPHGQASNWQQGYQLTRSDLVDRHGTLLATNLRTASAYAHPAMIDDPSRAAQLIHAHLPELDKTSLEQALDTDDSFIWIKRNITPEKKFALNSLGIPGIDFAEEQKRVYPHGHLFSHVLGFVNIDNAGLAGLEKSLDRTVTQPNAPQEVALSLDARVQHVLHDVLSAKRQEYEAAAASAIVSDVQTGEILAMVSLPDFDPHAPQAYDETQTMNRVSLGVYEMGSTLKSFTMALAVESGAVNMATQFDTSSPIHYARHSFRDLHPSSTPLSLSDVFARSSNVGTVQIAEAVGAERQREFLDRLGMFDPVPIELPERARPLVPSRWSDITMVTASFGYGLSVSPLHLVRAVSALVNGGRLVPLTLMKKQDGDVVDGERVISRHTSDIMRAMLRMVVTEGTARKANVEGYLVGGKTGTAEKLVNGAYKENALLSSFVAVFPIDQPKYLVFVMFDEPAGGEAPFGRYTASMTAVPTAGDIIRRIGPLLNVAPSPRAYDAERRLLKQTGVMVHRAAYHAD